MDKHTKLINNYKTNYDPIYYRPFLELALTKIGNLDDYNRVKLTNDQKIIIEDTLNDNNFSSEKFFVALESLTSEQICYIGW